MMRCSRVTVKDSKSSMPRIQAAVHGMYIKVEKETVLSVTAGMQKKLLAGVMVRICGHRHRIKGMYAAARMPCSGLHRQ